MKPKHILWLFTALVAVVAMAAGVAVLVNRFFGERIAGQQYIECTDEEELAE